MTTRIEHPAARRQSRDISPSTSHRSADDWSIRRASSTAGLGLLLMSVLAGWSVFVAVNGLVTVGNPTQTAQDILASAWLFRLGIAALVVVVALDVIVACALYRVFSPVNRALSMVAAALRLVYAGVFLVAVAQLSGVLRVLTDENRAVFGADQVNAQALLSLAAFSDIWFVGQFLFGLHLLIEGYLAYRSGYVPRVLGALLAVAGLGYAVDSLGSVLSQGPWTPVSSFTFLGELLLALWLLIRARSIAGRV
ncbi:MAG TPA: DUF4386 domain-containing protein [Propionibacteriaceae bacterium]